MESTLICYRVAAFLKTWHLHLIFQLNPLSTHLKSSVESCFPRGKRATRDTFHLKFFTDIQSSQSKSSSVFTLILHIENWQKQSKCWNMQQDTFISDFVPVRQKRVNVGWVTGGHTSFWRVFLLIPADGSVAQHALSTCSVAQDPFKKT